ncbi:MAG: MFS transporter [Alphaproteobacteria bacterium]|nr:MFS transporter [Alphaproteobacteria bacterium]MCB9694066.1 MFS transporter [Alphaproteobacteria bacterium]
MSSSLVTHRRFGPMFWTQFSGAFNDNFFKNALVILVVFKIAGALPDDAAVVFGLGKDAFAPLAGAVFILPFFLFSALGGQLADKYEKSDLIRKIKLAEIFIMLLGGFALVFAQVELLLLVLFLMGTQSTFFGPVKYGILPQLLDEEDLVGGNALVETATYLAILGGTIFGGVLVNLYWGEAPVGLWIVAVGVVIIAILGRAVAGRVPECEPTDPSLELQLDPFRPTWQIIRITMQKRPVWLSILGITWFWGFGASFLSLFPKYTKDVLGGDETIATLFLAVFSVGIGVGSMLCERFSRHRLELGLVPIGSFGMSFFTLVLFVVGQPWAVDPDALLSLVGFLSRPMGWVILLALLGIAASGGLYIVPLYTMIQQRSEDSERSRVIAGNNIINSAFMVVANLALVALLTQLSVTQIFAVLAVFNVLVAVYVYTVVPEFLLRFMAWMLSNVLYDVKLVGIEHLPRDTRAVMAGNHVSFVDWLVVMGAVQRPIRFVMYAGFAKGFVGWLAKQAKVIPIVGRKEDPALLERAMDQISLELQGDWVVGIFPEGRITDTGEMYPFRKGIEEIVERDPAPVVPFAINGLWGSVFSRAPGSSFPRGFRSPVTITLGPALPPEQVTAEAVQERVKALWTAGERK